MEEPKPKRVWRDFAAEKKQREKSREIHKILRQQHGIVWKNGKMEGL
jgi:hypothetical protein